MPIYEFKCQSCQEVFDLLMKLSDPHPETCEKCGKGPVEKLMSLTSFHLKGGGWYKDGYDLKSNKKSSTDTPASGKTDASSQDKGTSSGGSADKSPSPSGKAETKSSSKTSSGSSGGADKKA